MKKPPEAGVEGSGGGLEHLPGCVADHLVCTRAENGIKGQAKGDADFGERNDHIADGLLTGAAHGDAMVKGFKDCGVKSVSGHVW